jgi:hypothetical protein
MAHPLYIHTTLAPKGKGEVVPVHYALRTYWGSRGIAPPFLTSALDGGEWLASCLGRFIPGNHWIGGWVDPRSGLDVVEKRKSLPLPGTELGRPALNPSLYRLQTLVHVAC